MVSILIPLIAYLPSEWLGVSGVLAVVTAGLLMGRQLPKIIGSQQRLRLYSVWEAIIFILNGLVFVMMGLKLPEILDRLGREPLPTLVGYAIVISMVAIVVRMISIFPFATLSQYMESRIPEGPPQVASQGRVLIGWAGMTGIVSLAATLA